MGHVIATEGIREDVLADFCFAIAQNGCSRPSRNPERSYLPASAPQIFRRGKAASVPSKIKRGSDYRPLTAARDPGF
jgi:hypothetical protein